MGRTRSHEDTPTCTAPEPQPAAKGSRKSPQHDAQDDGAAKTAEGGSFEQSAERLGQIVEQLERGDLPLEQSLKLFEEGVSVARAAQSRLEQAERRVEELLGLDEKREPITREIDRED